MFVKICGITNEADALLAVAVGADAIGFVFAPSPRQVPPTRVAEIIRRLPSDIATVGVFRNELPERIRTIVNQTGLTAVQLHGDEGPDDVRALRHDVRMIFKAVPAGSDAFAFSDRFGADAILVDNPNPGSGQVFDWRLAEDAPTSVRLILAGGLRPDNVANAISKVDPWGVDVSSGVERSPGIKDAALVREFVANARAAGAAHQRDHETRWPSSAAPGAEPYNWQEDVTWR